MSRRNGDFIARLDIRHLVAGPYEYQVMFASPLHPYFGDICGRAAQETQRAGTSGSITFAWSRGRAPCRRDTGCRRETRRQQ